MASTIDATKPTHASPQTADVRANFLAAKTEIEALQTSVAGLAPTANPTFTGVVTLDVGATFNADSGTATATAGAATLNKMAGKITSEALTTAAGADYTLTLTNSTIAAADMVFASVANGTNTGGIPSIETITEAAGSIVIVIHNMAIAAAFNGTLVIKFHAMKA